MKALLAAICPSPGPDDRKNGAKCRRTAAPFMGAQAARPPAPERGRPRLLFYSSGTDRGILVIVGDENDRADADQQADEPDDPARIALKLVRARSSGGGARGARRGRRRDRSRNDRQGRKR